MAEVAITDLQGPYLSVAKVTDLLWNSACMTIWVCQHASMIGKHVQMDDAVYGRLREFAMRRHRSMAACIRDAIGDFLRQGEDAADDLSDIAGKFRPLSMEDIKDHDRHWAESLVKEKLGQ